jgi:hypothetical protein
MSSCKNKVYSILGFKIRLNWRETHHGYYGAFLMLISPLCPYTAVILAIGLYLLGDDTFQHHVQVKEYSPCYHSPVHRFIYDYLKLYDRAWFRALNKFVDWLFHNPLMLAIVLCAIILVIIVLKG